MEEYAGSIGPQHQHQNGSPLMNFGFRRARQQYASVDPVAASELPLESDRKAVLGCLAVVLASIQTHAICDGPKGNFVISYEDESRSETTSIRGGKEGEKDATGGVARVPDDNLVLSSLETGNDHAEERAEALPSNHITAMEADPGGNNGSSNGASVQLNDGSTILRNNEAEMVAAVCSDDANSPHQQPMVIRTNVTSAFFQKESRNDMTTALRGKHKERAQHRYRRRQYELKWELLQCTARLLLLEESEAIALMPILSASETNHDSGGDGDDGPVDLSVLMDPFLHQLSSTEAAFSILAMLLFHLLLSSSSSSSSSNDESSAPRKNTFVGYDSRVRHALKRLAAVILTMPDNHNVSPPPPPPVDQNLYLIDSEDEDESDAEEEGAAAKAQKEFEDTADAIRKFENLEHAIAVKLMLLSKLQKEEAEKPSGGGSASQSPSSASARKQFDQSDKDGTRAAAGADAPMIRWEPPTVATKDKLLRHISIVGASLAAGTIFAVTGGLAAPGIAATVGMIAGSTFAATAAVVTLTGTIAMSTVFGVGGAGLVAAKVEARTRGLKEFVFKRGMQAREQVELTRTVCISGWIKDSHDFERPWGITPEGLTDKLELLRRFYAVYEEQKVEKCPFILKQWSGTEEKLWDLLRETYGRDPDHLLPLKGPMDDAVLDEDQNVALDRLLETLGYPQLSRRADQIGSFHFDGDGDEDEDEESTSSPYRKSKSAEFKMSPIRANGGRGGRRTPRSNMNRNCPWDFHSTFGGELYTIRWEPELLMTLNDSMMIVGQEVAQTATLKVLQETALASLASALSLPSNLMRFTRLIDGAWALCCKRADEAGIQLAKSLLLSTAGHRPVTLIGYGMGARMIYSCLKELAYHQEKWEDEREYVDPVIAKTPGSMGSRTETQLRRWRLNMKKNRRQQQQQQQQQQQAASQHGSPHTGSEDGSSSDNASHVSETSTKSGNDSSSGSTATTEDKGTRWRFMRPRSRRPSEASLGATESTDTADGDQKQSSAPKKEVPSCDKPVMTYSREPASIVEDAILMGCPAYIHRPSWEACRRMVGGRVVNCYSPSDLILALMFQYECMSGLFRPTCGTYPINVPGIENYNVSEWITAHSDYSIAVGEILEVVQHSHPVATVFPEDDGDDGASDDASQESQMVYAKVETSDDDDDDDDDKDNPPPPRKFRNIFELNFGKKASRRKMEVEVEGEDSSNEKGESKESEDGVNDLVKGGSQKSQDPSIVIVSLDTQEILSNELDGGKTDGVESRGQKSEMEDVILDDMNVDVPSTANNERSEADKDDETKQSVVIIPLDEPEVEEGDESSAHENGTGPIAGNVDADTASANLDTTVI